MTMVDLSDDASFADGFPHAAFDWLRDNDPVHWHKPTEATPDGEGFWVVSRYEDVNKVFRAPDIFSSDKAGARTGGGTTLKDERAAGKVLNYTDDPHHRTLRNLVNKGFTNQALAALEHELRRRANLLIDAFPEGETFDFVSHFSRELPLQAICIILGVPQEDRTELCDWIDKGLEADGQNVIAMEYVKMISEYARGIIQQKRQNPAGDILSKIVHAQLDEEDGRQLTDEELVNFFILLFPAGAETTRSAIGGGLRTLIEHPDQLTRLRTEPDLLRTAIEEIARWTTPSIYKRRTVTRDTELAGKLSKPETRLLSGRCPRTATTASSKTPTASTSPAARTSISPTGRAPISVSAPASREWSCGSVSRNCSNVSGASNWRVRPNGFPTTACLACGGFR